LPIIRRGQLGKTVALHGLLGLQASAQGWTPLIRVADACEGDPSTRTGGESVSKRRTIYTAVSNIATPAYPASPRTFRALCKVQVFDGNDLGAAEVEYLIPAGIPITVAGSIVLVSTQLFADELGLVQLPATCSATVSAFATDDEGQGPVQLSTWIRPVPGTPLAASQQIATGPRHMKQYQGYNGNVGGGNRWLMWFDWPPPGAPTLPNAGVEPLFAVGPIPPETPFSNDFITSTVVFTYGALWMVSTAADFVAPDPASLFRVDSELYADARFPQSI
jgi:hypothetical protein